MIQVGYVVAVEEGVADVALGEHLECNKCGACLATIGKKRKSIKAANGMGADVGDRVEVETPPGFTVAAAFVLFIFPILAGAAGAYLGRGWLGALGLGLTAGAVVMAAVFVAFSLIVIRYIDRVYFSRQMPKIVNVLHREESKEGRR